MLIPSLVLSPLVAIPLLTYDAPSESVAPSTPPSSAPTAMHVEVNTPPWALNVTAQAFGVRGSVTSVRGGDADTQGYSVTLAAEGFGYTTKAFSQRGVFFASLGGGSAGFEGSLGAEDAWGARLPVSEGQGPLFRLGYRAYLFGNDRLYSSLLELPQGQLGYQITLQRVLFEIAATGGPVLAGRYNIGEGTVRKLGSSFEWGGHISLITVPVHLEVGFTRVNVQDGPVDMLIGTLCGHHALFAICMDTRAFQGNGKTPLSAEHTSLSKSLYAGVLLGLGGSSL